MATMMGGTAKQPGALPAPVLSIDPVGLSRYHASANTVLCAGIVGGVVFGAVNVLPAWGGFLVGSVPAFLLATLGHTLNDDQ
jgi:hypothetical protein